MAETTRPVTPGLQRAVLLGFFAVYGAFLALPRVQASPGLFWAIAGSWLLFAGWLGALALGARRRGEPFGMQFMPRKPHLVQIVMHSSVFAYWGWHWDLVYAQVPLIVAQVFFAYLLDVGLSWKRYRNFRLGFGQWPIIGSTNLFLWFKDDYFALQLGMIAIAYLAREYIKWERDGRKVHILNPSAIGLTVAALGLIATQQVHQTWGAEISVTLGYGPLAFEQIFLAGVIVQLLFAVGLVTASAAVSAVLLGLLWYAVTGTWLFVDTAIPIAVFLGMTLLVTDPVSSPYTDGGKIAFGVLYSVGVMGLYILLRGMERPAIGDDPGLTVAFFDKVLQVPLMNLMVRWLDRVFGGIPVRAWTERLVRLVRPADRPRPTGVGAIYAGGGLGHRVAHVLMWGGAFVAIRPQLIEHPGADPAFWQARCGGGADATACENWRRVLVGACDAGAGEACHNLGVIYEFGEGVPADVKDAGFYYELACDKGTVEGCNHLGGVLMTQASAPEAQAEARRLFQRACDGGSLGGCTRLGVMALQAQGGPMDRALARKALTTACTGGDGQGCDQLGILSLRPPNGQLPDPKAAARYFSQACSAGFKPGCEHQQQLSGLRPGP